MRRTLLWGLLFLVGCSSPYVRLDSGYGNGDLEPLGRKGGEKVDIVQFSARYGSTLLQAGDFAVDGEIGPTVIIPTKHQEGDGFGVEAVGRVRYAATDLWEPYLSLGTGAVWYTDRWEPQATDWGFLVLFGLGSRWRVGEGQWINTEYRYWHTSNGSAIFGSPSPNPGFDSGAIFVGYERSF